MNIFCCPICHGALRGQSYEDQVYRECPKGHGVFVRSGLFFRFPKVSRPNKKSTTKSLACPACSGGLESSQGSLVCRHCSSHWLGESEAAAFKKGIEALAEEEKAMRLEAHPPFIPSIGGLSGVKAEGLSPTIIWMAFVLLAAFFLKLHLPAIGSYTVFYPTDPFYNFGANFFLSLHSHGNAWHLCSNLFFLVFMGSLIERHLSKQGVLGIFVLSGVAANLTQIVVGLPHPTMGASGGVAGLVVALVLLEPKAHLTFSFWPSPNARFYLPCELLAVLWLLVEIHGLVKPVEGINHWAHLSGAFAGFLCLQLGFVSKAPEAGRTPGTPSLKGNPARPALWR